VVRWSHMRKAIARDRGALAFFTVTFALVTFAAIVSTVIIAREGFGSNGAAWVQAGGSIAAIAGAVWLFRGETIRRRRERRTLGEEVAWAVRFALTNAQLEARTIAAELFDKRGRKKKAQDAIGSFELRIAEMFWTYSPSGPTISIRC
jgi:hypothetical protein